MAPSQPALVALCFSHHLTVFSALITALAACAVVSLYPLSLVFSLSLSLCLSSAFPRPLPLPSSLVLHPSTRASFLVLPIILKSGLCDIGLSG
eukprot:9501060-Pyramimonas_sp.AAC.1